MDPEETLIAYFDAVSTDDRCAAEDHLSNLLEWVQKDGYLPGLKSIKLRAYLQEEMIDTDQVDCKVCHKVTDRKTAHLHGQQFVCDGCWDERLRGNA